MRLDYMVYVCRPSGWLQVGSHRRQRSAEKIARNLADTHPTNHYCVAQGGKPLYGVFGRDAVQPTEAK